MKTKFIFSFAILFGLILSGCDANIFDKDNTVKIRIENASEFEMENIVVLFPGKEVAYGDISPNGRSSYTEVDKAYRYAYIETEVNGTLSVLQPIDFVGESFLASGSYSYVLSLHDYDEGQHSDSIQFNLSLELRKD